MELVTRDKFIAGLNLISQISRSGYSSSRSFMGTKVDWVNWRESSAQVKLTWNGHYSLSVYIDVHPSAKCGSAYETRDLLLKSAFTKYMPEGSKPRTDYGRGGSMPCFGFSHKEIITPNDLADIADSLGITYTVIYVQDDISSRPAFNVFGIPLVPGEMGKEWINGEYHPYSCPINRCL